MSHRDSNARPCISTRHCNLCARTMYILVSLKQGIPPLR